MDVFSLDAFVAAFLPLFVALNIPGVLPLYIGMTEAMEGRARRALLIRAMTVAVVVALLMLFAGGVIFQTLGITVHDLRVGGGLILLVLAITDLVFGDMKKRRGGSKKDLRVTLKLNVTDTSRVRYLLEQNGYRIAAAFNEDDSEEEFSLRVQEFMRYLEV